MTASKTINDLARFRGGPLNALAQDIHREAVATGWWPADPRDRDLGQVHMLVVSELAEAYEGARRDLKDDHLPGRSMFDAEICDALIRLLDLAGALAIDVDAIVAEKRSFNRARRDHEVALRAADPHGKRW
jgi:hypothetical protein